MTFSWSWTGSALHFSISWTHFWNSRTVPPDPANEVDAPHGRPWLPKVRDAPDEVQRGGARPRVELQVRMGPGPEGEDPSLGDGHDVESLWHLDVEGKPGNDWQPGRRLLCSAVHLVRQRGTC